MSDPRRDCQCPRARHQHGTRAAYERDRCRCLICRAAHANSVREYRNGRTWREALVHGIGTARRLRALAVIGHSSAALGDQLGMSGEMVSHYRRLTHVHITPSVAAAVTALYGELWDKPDRSADGRRCSTQARRYGWLPPMGWDDEQIDKNPITGITQPGDADPLHCADIIDEIAVSEAIYSRPVRLTRHEMSAATHKLTGMGYSARETAQRLGTTERQVTRIRAAARREDAA